jgi:hypothetical protein
VESRLRKALSSLNQGLKLTRRNPRDEEVAVSPTYYFLSGFLNPKKDSPITINDTIDGIFCF